MFLDFSDRAFKGLLTHQGRVLAEYQSKALDEPDVAIKLPTGSGKTLVGTLIGEWRRRSKEERVVYVCPTKQLVHQVVEEATSKYGMGDAVAAFVGPKADFAASDKARYQAGEIIAVTTYAGFFNANTFFDEPNLIVFDDAHAAENYIAQHWTLEISRRDNPTIFTACANVLAQVLSGLDAKRLTEESQNFWDSMWVDSVPTPILSGIQQQLVAVIDEHVASDNLRWRWREIRDHLRACRVYVSSSQICIRPLVPPTLRYPAFRHATQRIYMSATLGAGGDLERVTGVPRIYRLSVPDDFSAQGVGRRFFILPGRSLEADEQDILQCAAIEEAKKAVVLVPDFRSATEVEAQIASTVKFPVFSAVQIEESKAPFVAEPKAVAILANRYDGIDFPDEQCRLLILRGLPSAANLQERFLISRMGAGLLMADRVRTRFIQAVGRCTRSPTDYSAVILLGEDLQTYVNKRETRAALHPELQAEVAFGLEQSGTTEEMIENLRLFYARGDEWRAADNEIRRLRGEAKQVALPSLDQLNVAAQHEVKFQYAMWDGNYDDALAQARQVITALQDSSLKGYRAFWNYLAGEAANQLAAEGMSGQESVAREYFSIASRATTGVHWLRQLSGQRDQQSGVQSPGASAAVLIERLEKRLDDLGTRHDERYAKLERLIMDGLAQTEASAFENAQKELGSLIGFEAGNVETPGAPDPWWLADESFAIIFEDYTDAAPTSRLSVTKARQVASHPVWLRNHLGLDENTEVIPVLVSSVKGADTDAAVHLQAVAYWPLGRFRTWALNVLATIRRLRTTYPGAGDLLWREEAMSAYATAGIDPDSLRQRLQPLRGAKDFSVSSQ
jgi:Rad3-related DNA helicase